MPAATLRVYNVRDFEVAGGPRDSVAAAHAELLADGFTHTTTTIDGVRVYHGKVVGRFGVESFRATVRELSSAA